MNLYKFYITLFFLSLSCIAQNKNQEEFRIEVIVFEQLEIIGNEKLERKNLNLQDINTIALLDKPNIALNEQTIFQSFNYEKTNLSIDQLIINKNKNEQVQDSDPPKPGKRINENKWYERQQNLNKLDNIYRRLNRRNEYQILHKVSWLQPALPEDNSPFVHEIFSSHGFLIKLYQSRYLHLDVIAYLEGNFRPENDQELIKEIKFDALTSSIPDNVLQHDFNIGPEIMNSNKIFKTEPEMAETKTESLEYIEIGEVRYLLNEGRRIFKNESHYFDHPKIGVIISVYDSSL
tara:strand:+ start:45134 stop:46006 length:873 start_codon:yes stop_codon:yes gene_type:complete